jgi:hypothetical protein
MDAERPAPMKAVAKPCLKEATRFWKFARDSGGRSMHGLYFIQI